MANFTCLAGYTLDGDHFLTCQLDTAWTPSLPVCVECTTLENPFSGKVVLTTDGLVTIATYSCLADYYMIGTEIRTCQTDGAWDLSAPECDCNAPDTPSGGSVVVSGTTATYTCDMRYTLSGSKTRTCQRDGTGWSGADPTCTSCASLIGPTSGVYALTTDGVQTSASLSCGNGYSLNGALQVKCLSDGTWETLPTCIHCESLSSPNSGSFSLSTTGINTLATYACTTGYNLNGDTSRMCLSTGIWTLAAPICSCQSPTTPSNGHVTDDGATATYTCSVGYSLDGVSSRTCGSDGTGWSGSDPSCTPCSTLTTPTGGTVTLTTDNLQTMASYTCDVGYTLNGLSSITCRSDGTWDFSQPECSLCPTLTAPSSGNVSLSTDQLTTTASFLCSSGYYISGSLTITCRTDGQWSDNVPTCKCNFPAHPGNGAVSVSDTSSGPVASYSCDLGYSIEGSASRLCLSDGTGWDATDPSCNVCASITTPTEMGFAQSTNGTTTKGSYTCAVNYTLDGEPVHECLADGTWNNQQPSCVQCEITYNPLSGSVSLSTDGLTTMATFSCVSGYSLNSTSITTCQTDATWNLPSPTCLCDPPPAVNNGVIVLLNEGRLANYTCNEGYELVGTYMRTCQDDGTGWTGTSPRCDAIQNTPASSAASTDNSVLPLHLGIVVALVAVIVTLLIAVIICTYLRYRKDNSKISATFDDGESEMPIAEESRHNTERGISNGKAHLIGKEIEKKPSFNVKKLKQDMSASDVRINASTPPVPVKENGASHSLPLTSVRLPKLPPKPPQAHQINSNKPKRKRTSPRKHVTPRTSTPIEIQMSRVETPEILSTAEFNYINPVYCHEVETPTSSRPTTCNDSSRRSFRVNQASSSESNA